MSRIVLAALLVASPALLSAQPTYSREVSRIMQQKCQICHRPDDIAPFSLMSYDDAVSRARQISAVVQSGIMPPWKPVPGHGDFKSNFSLTDEEKQTILDWIGAETPEGDPAEMPPPVVYSGEWRHGAPDQVISMPTAFLPQPTEDRHDQYRCFILPNDADRDRYVKSVDIVPGVRAMVHHVILYMVDSATEKRKADRLEAEDSDPGYDCWGGPRVTPSAGPGLSVIKLAGGMLGAWVPGMQVSELPEDIGILVPKSAYIIMQVHYNLEALEQPLPDLTRVGLYFHENTPKNRLLTLPLLNNTFEIPAGTMDAEVKAEFSLSLAGFGLNIDLPDVLIPKFSAIRIGPHMHQLGHKVRIDMTTPSGEEVPLIRIDDWDFHWQNFYDYSHAVDVPYGSKLKLSCTFDNTTERTIRWGESTQDEMCLGYIGFVMEGGIAPVLLGR